ncbi:Amidohydrolase 3 [Beutenbergia cavernae DSM 12333]|uniref:Amidohydrolase 3 n=1 Tax=Beutenbergia cavernae (strain ATCC BAA-8 / DSM 12333 / CCUG 43141 / JCM 11478 / NBRC 16432 / NCIMB 13614 / HKI 0122) TaxID=471853 RepID=C5C426_BEUC1|nr:amidohydrolase family protein [Beutenbergia cavernae]ACQ79939.1 Amidohydrolase 3 [Beutenbergia cavernae DSM 12333]
MTVQLLRGGRLASGEVVDVRVDADTVTAVVPADGGSGLDRAGAAVTDLTGYVLCGAFAEPHTHLDKVFTADRVTGHDGTLRGAMERYATVLGEASDADVRARAHRALRLLVGHGATAVRSHVGCGRLLGVRAVESLVRVRSEAADVVDLQLVAHVGPPGVGESWRSHRARLHDALDAGADVVGGNPSIEPDPVAAMEECFAVAVERGRPVDFHVDETTEPAVLTLRHLARLARQADVPVTASHCVSLGQQDPALAADVAAEVAEAGVQVVALPATNLYLQGRGGGPSTRGLTAIDTLRAAGVRCAAGGDNVRDPFNPAGRLDPLETAALVVTAGHQAPRDAWHMVGRDARAVLGLPAAGPRVGDRADLVAVRADSLEDALALAPAERIVWRAGRVVSRIAVTRRGPVHEVGA